MKILHFSDNHGSIPDWNLEGIDLVICTGDFFPTAQFKSPDGRSFWAGEDLDRKGQIEWLEDAAPAMAKWLGEKPFLWCGGNHDWISPVPALVKLGVKAHDTTEQRVSFGGLDFYGFPFIPFIEGHWNFEKQRGDMVVEWDKFLTAAGDKGMPDVLLMHAPMRGVLDQCTLTGNHYGDPVRLNSLGYYDGLLPKVILHGHVHNPDKMTLRLSGQDVRVYNAATSFHIVEV